MVVWFMDERILYDFNKLIVIIQSAGGLKLNVEKSGIVFLGLLLLGAGIGAFAGDVKIGSAIGLGAGIITIALFRK